MNFAVGSDYATGIRLPADPDAGMEDVLCRRHAQAGMYALQHSVGVKAGWPGGWRVAVHPPSHFQARDAPPAIAPPTALAPLPTAEAALDTPLPMAEAAFEAVLTTALPT